MRSTYLSPDRRYPPSLFESNIDALMTTDAAAIIAHVNKQMEALTGATCDELIGAPFKTFFTDANRAEAGIKLALSKKKRHRLTHFSEAHVEEHQLRFYRTTSNNPPRINGAVEGPRDAQCDKPLTSGFSSAPWVRWSTDRETVTP